MRRSLHINRFTSPGIGGACSVLETDSRYRMLPVLVFVSYAAFLLLTLPDYGVTWDEVGWFRYGYEQWDSILHGTTRSLKDSYSYYNYGSLPSLAAAATHHLFHDILGWTSSHVGYHLSNVAFALLLSVGILIWGKQTLGNAGASLALLIWMLLPRLWPDAHYNISDLPGAAGCLWTAWAIWRISQASKARVADYVLCGFFAGVAYSLRAPNVYFLGLAILIWFCGCRWLLNIRWPALNWWGPLLAIVVFFLTAKVATPPLWHESVLKQVLWTSPQSYLNLSSFTGRNFAFAKEDLWFMGQYYPIDQPPRYYAAWFWFISTPLIVIVCSVIGAGKIFHNRAEGRPTLLLWLILWTIAVFKHVGGAGNYDGVRHFLEGYAPMSLLAAHGSLILLRWIKDMPLWRKRLAYGFVALGVIFPLYTGWRIHPYQSGYFNLFAGPLARAWQDYEVEYWGHSFLPASEWVKQYVDPRTAIYVPEGAHIAKFYLSPSFKVNTMTPYWEFTELKEFKASLNAFLEKAPPGSVLMKLNRPRVYRDETSFGCPLNWEMIHREGPDPKLPPMMIICRKGQQQTA
jgi:hypothetical protein